MASEGGGWEVVGRWWSDATIASEILVPGSNPENHNFFFDGRRTENG
jgi:hypothetical protein